MPPHHELRPRQNGAEHAPPVDRTESPRRAVTGTRRKPPHNKRTMALMFGFAAGAGLAAIGTSEGGPGSSPHDSRPGLLAEGNRSASRAALSGGATSGMGGRGSGHVLMAGSSADADTPSEEAAQLARTARVTDQRVAREKAERERRQREAAERAARNRAVPPLQGGEITSSYGSRWGTTHYGLDIAHELGTPIVAPKRGVVLEAGPASGFGLWVRIRHEDGSITVYGHIDSYSVSPGQQVEAGDVVAEVGNRGQSTGPHLHFEAWTPSGEKVDPLAWLREQGVDM